MYARLRARLDQDRQAGFTLIELLIVIVILGILAAIVVFAVGGISDRGKKSACKADVKSVQTAVEAFRAKTGAYPAALTNLRPDYIRELPAATAAAAGDGGYYVSYTPTAITTPTARSAGEVWSTDTKGTADTTDDAAGCPA